MAWEFEPPNPISSYGVGLEFAAPLPPEMLREVSALHSQVRTELPRRVEQKGITLQPFAMFGMQVGTPGAPIIQEGIAAVTFDRLLPDGRPHSAMNVNPLGMNYTVTQYSRWVEYWPLAERLIGMVTRIIMPQIPVTAFRLQANNRFTTSGQSPIRELVKESDYLPGFILECAPPCHFSLGWQTAQPGDLSGQRTDNMNLIVGGTSGSSTLDLNFNYRLLFDSALRDAALFDLAHGRGQSRIAEIFFSLHNANNKLFSTFLADSIIHSIPGMPLPC